MGRSILIVGVIGAVIAIAMMRGSTKDTSSTTQTVTQDPGTRTRTSIHQTANEGHEAAKQRLRTQAVRRLRHALVRMAQDRQENTVPTRPIGEPSTVHNRQYLENRNETQTRVVHPSVPLSQQMHLGQQRRTLSRHGSNPRWERRKLGQSGTGKWHSALEEAASAPGDVDAGAQTALDGMAISGVVRDERGDPVAGVTIVPASLTGVHTAGQVQISGPRGNFSFDSLPEGEYLLHTRTTQLYGPSSQRARTGSGSIVITLPDGNRNVRITGIVKDPDGAPLSGVRIRQVRKPYIATTHDNGQFSFVVQIKDLSGTLNIEFLSNGYRPHTVPITAVHAVERGELELHVQLESATDVVLVHGTVTDNYGEPVPTATVELHSALLQRTYKAITNMGGEFVFAQVQVGTDYLFTARSGGSYEAYSESNVEIASGDRDLSFQMRAIPNGVFQGQMVDPDGYPVPNFTLWLRNPHANKLVPVVGDSEGLFALEGIPIGPASLQTLSDPQFFVSGIEIATEQEAVRIPLDWGQHKLSGVILDADGTPVAGAEMTLRAEIGSIVRSRSMRRTRTDSRGRFVFTQLGSGPHQVTATAPEFQSERVDHMVDQSGNELVLQLAP